MGSCFLKIFVMFCRLIQENIVDDVHQAYSNLLIQIAGGKKLLVTHTDVVVFFYLYLADVSSARSADIFRAMNNWIYNPNLDSNLTV